MVLDWFKEYGAVIIFYAAIILLIYFNRNKFEFQGKIIALYRTKLGISFMQKIADKYPRTVKFLGVVGIYVGFAGMLFMVYMIVLGLYQLFFVPSAPPMFAPILPGISIPGSPITLPLLEGLISLFVVVVIHEFTHGVISKAYKIPIKSSGFVMFGPLPGAFVEPDEKKLEKASVKARLSMFAGGPFANVLLSFVLFFVILGMALLSTSMYNPAGVEVYGFTDVNDSLEGGRLGSLEEGEVILKVDDFETLQVFNLSDSLTNRSPGDAVLLTTDKGVKEITLGANPGNESLPYLGIYLNHKVEGNNGLSNNKVFSAVYFWLFGNPYDLRFNHGLGLIGWIFIISVGIGIVNLLPVGPLDGGRMFLLVLEKRFKKKVAHKIWVNTAKILLVCLGVLILFPILRAIF